MRILHLSMLYPPHIIGGAEKSVQLLCEALAGAGHEIAASCTTPQASFEEQVNGIPVYRIAHGTRFWAEEWPQHGRLARLTRKAMLPFSTDFEAGFDAVLRAFRPQIVHTHSLTDVSTRAWLAAARAGVPIVHTLRDYDLLCANSSLFHDGKVCETRHLRCRVLTAAKRAHHQHVGAVVGVGQGILDTHLQHGYFEQVPQLLRRVIWNPAVLDAPLPARAAPAADAPLVFGYIGRINVEKGVGTLLRACRRLSGGRPWRLLVAGKSPLPDDPLFRLAEGLPVEFLGFVSAASFFARIDVQVVPSIWPEPLPRTILEGYAAGVPAIGARSGGIPDLIGADQHDWLFPGDDDEALAARMQRLLNLGRDALPPPQRYAAVLSETTPAKVVERYESVYRALLGA